jgi:streptogramin lyase
VTQAAGDLVRLDPDDGTVQSRTPIGQGARLASVGARAVHVAQFEEDSIVDVDPHTGRVTQRREVCDGPQGMAEAGGLLWVACTPDDLVVGLDLATLKVREQVEVAGQPDSVLAAPDGSVLVVAEEGPTLVRIDPASAEVVGRLALAGELPLFDDANLDLAVTDDEVWVTSYAADLVHHVPLAEVPTGS